MTPSEPRAGRRTRSAILAALLVVSAALIGAASCQASAASWPSASSRIATAPDPGAQGHHRPDDQGAAGEADGVVPDGVTVFDTNYPAVANLDPKLLAALRRATTDASHDGIKILINSGWRSAKYQNQLLQQAIEKYGSKAAAERWVATAKTSAHVSGHAVDVGPAAATVWLSEHGAAYGLCQIYSNEPWHYELRPAAVDHGCPTMYADPTRDPRMQQ